jgi:hypothetical protein
MSPQSYFLKKTYTCELAPSPLPLLLHGRGEGGTGGEGANSPLLMRDADFTPSYNRMPATAATGITCPWAAGGGKG